MRKYWVVIQNIREMKQGNPLESGSRKSSHGCDAEVEKGPGSHCVRTKEKEHVR